MANHAQRNLLHAYLDDELDLVRSMELEDHLAECSDCAHEVASYRAVRETVQAANLRYEVSADFLARVRNELQREQKRAEPKRELLFSPRKAPWWSWAMAAACLLLTAAAFIFNANRQHGSDLARDIVADHVRSLMASHLTDVLTSDQHTVKPWFTGKLDFSPQVRDLSNDGFELVGGRLDYIEGHNAAAIVYQRRKHMINVFTWPDSGSDKAPHATAQQGFNLIQWRQAGMYYCAASDLNQQELSTLVTLLRH